MVLPSVFHRCQHGSLHVHGSTQCTERALQRVNTNAKMVECARRSRDKHRTPQPCTLGTSFNSYSASDLVCSKNDIVLEETPEAAKRREFSASAHAISRRQCDATKSYTREPPRARDKATPAPGLFAYCGWKCLEIGEPPNWLPSFGIPFRTKQRRVPSQKKKNTHTHPYSKNGIKESRRARLVLQEVGFASTVS